MLKKENFEVLSVYPKNPTKEVREYLKGLKEKILNSIDGLQKFSEILLDENIPLERSEKFTSGQFGFNSGESKKAKEYLNTICTMFDDNDVEAYFSYRFVDWSDSVGEFHVDIGWKRIEEQDEYILYELNAFNIVVRYKKIGENQYKLIDNQTFKVHPMSSVLIRYNIDKTEKEEVLKEIREKSLPEIELLTTGKDDHSLFTKKDWCE